MGISVDSSATQKAFCSSLGGIPYPVLADFNPKGQVAQNFGVYDPGRGTSQRAVFLIDKDGIVRWKQLYPQGLPNPVDVLAEIDRL